MWSTQKKSIEGGIILFRSNSQLRCIRICAAYHAINVLTTFETMEEEREDLAKLMKIDLGNAEQRRCLTDSMNIYRNMQLNNMNFSEN